MENLVPLGTGNSRLMKSNIPPNTTLAQLIQMWNNGTFPYDIGPLNSAGISQQGTPLTKDTLLKDATAALFGLGTDAVPDDALSAINTLIDGKASIVTGSYVGTGQYGSGHPNTIKGSFPPKLLLIYGEYQFNGYTWGTTGIILCEIGGVSIITYTDGAQDAQAYIKSTVSQNTVSWYSTMDVLGNGNGSAQLNRSGTTYRYALIG